MPVVSSARLLKFFTSRGFVKKSQKGSHITLKKEGIKRRLVIPANKKELSFTVIFSNLKTAEISHEEFIRDMQK